MAAYGPLIQIKIDKNIPTRVGLFLILFCYSVKKTTLFGANKQWA